MLKLVGIRNDVSGTFFTRGRAGERSLILESLLSLEARQFKKVFSLCPNKLMFTSRKLIMWGIYRALSTTQQIIQQHKENLKFANKPENSPFSSSTWRQNQQNPETNCFHQLSFLFSLLVYSLNFDSMKVCIASFYMEIRTNHSESLTTANQFLAEGIKNRPLGEGLP